MLGYKDAPLARNSTEAHDFMGRWDLGTRRSLAQLIDFTGVDTINHEVRGVGRMGGKEGGAVVLPMCGSFLDHQEWPL